MDLKRFDFTRDGMEWSDEGDWCFFEDAQAEIETLRSALREALPALRMAFKGGHQLTESDYRAYQTACDLCDPPND